MVHSIIFTDASSVYPGNAILKIPGRNKALGTGLHIRRENREEFVCD
jgi:hypothetical protein